MIRKTRNRILKILLVLFALCLHLAVLYVAIKAVKRFLNTTFTVSYQMTYQTTMAGELVQEVKRFGSTTAVTAVPDLGYEFVEWSDGVKTPTREDKFVIKSFAVYPICKVAVLDAPVICISTEERASVESREEYVNCSISVIDTDESYSITEAPAQIRGRGNGSWWYDKKSYKTTKKCCTRLGLQHFLYNRLFVYKISDKKSRSGLSDLFNAVIGAG